MDPYYEQRLREEVIYLHNLWRQGPPPRSSSATTNLHPLNPTQFKKQKKKKPISKTRQPKKVGSFSGTEWPVSVSDDNPPATQSGWPELKLKPKPNPATRQLTPEELAKFNWNQVQQKALKAAKDFFLKNVGSDGEEEEEDDGDDMDEDDDDIEEKEYDFFWKMFNEEEELKGYYVKNCGGGGDFSCLVCGGANEKSGKRFKDCVALVQHSVSIAKTKKIRSHRAYGQVICKVLGWDIDHLPSSIVTDFKAGESQGNDGGDHRDSNVGTCDAGLNKIWNNGNSLLRVDSDASEEVHGASNPVEDESMVCNANADDADKALNPGTSNKVMDPNASEIGHVEAPEGSNLADGESMVCEISPGVASSEDREDNRKLGLNEAEGTAGCIIVNNLEPVDDNVVGSSRNGGTKVDIDVKNHIVLDGPTDETRES